MSPAEQSRFANQVQHAVQAGWRIEQAALTVAGLLDPTAPEASSSLAYVVLRRARRNRDAALEGLAICHLNTARTQSETRPCAKIAAYVKAFEQAVRTPGQKGVATTPLSAASSKKIMQLLPFAGGFLELIEEQRRWDLATTWIPIFKEASSHLLQQHHADFEDTIFGQQMERIEQKLQSIPASRKSTDVQQHDTTATLADVETARSQGRYRDCEDMLDAAMRSLGWQESANHCCDFYGPAKTLPLLVQLAIARVQILHEGALSDSFSSDHNQRRKETARQLCQALDSCYWKPTNSLSRSIKASIKELTSDEQLLSWFAGHSTGPDISSWDTP
jgi:hypothetical protein